MVVCEKEDHLVHSVGFVWVAYHVVVVVVGIVIVVVVAVVIEIDLEMAFVEVA